VKTHRRALPKNSVHLQPESYGATGLVCEGTYERTVFLGPEDKYALGHPAPPPAHGAGYV